MTRGVLWDSCAILALCDAISFAVLDGRCVSRAFIFDHHFRQHGRIHVPGLE